MNVSQVARAAGLSPSGVRWYESIGVLSPAPRRENGYRDYGPHDLSILRLALSLRRLGLPAVEAGGLARACLDRGVAPNQVLGLLRDQREAVARQRRELDQLEHELNDFQATLNAVGNEAPAARTSPLEVLFLCNANSGRSQIAEALLGKFGATRFHAASAGKDPRPVSDLAVAALAEVDVDWRAARSKHIDELRRHSFDYVVTLSDSMRETCASLPGRHSALHWHLPDPQSVEGNRDVRLDAYRRTRDEIALRLRPFVELALRTGPVAEKPESRLAEATGPSAAPRGRLPASSRSA